MCSGKLCGGFIIFGQCCPYGYRVTKNELMEAYRYGQRKDGRPGNNVLRLLLLAQA